LSFQRKSILCCAFVILASLSRHFGITQSAFWRQSVGILAPICWHFASFCCYFGAIAYPYNDRLNFTQDPKHILNKAPMKVNNACHDIFQLKTQKLSSKREHTIIPHQKSIKTLKNERKKETKRQSMFSM
jgi:hypothetical protein